MECTLLLYATKVLFSKWFDSNLAAIMITVSLLYAEVANRWREWWSHKLTFLVTCGPLCVRNQNYLKKCSLVWCKRMIVSLLVCQKTLLLKISVFFSSRNLVRGQTNLDLHDPVFCSQQQRYKQWGSPGLPECPNPDFAGGGAQVTTIWKVKKNQI